MKLYIFFGLISFLVSFTFVYITSINSHLQDIKKLLEKSNNELYSVKFNTCILVRESLKKERSLDELNKDLEQLARFNKYYTNN